MIIVVVFLQMRAAVLATVLAICSLETRAVKIANAQYNLNVIHHPHGAQSVYNPFVKATFPQQPQLVSGGQSYFGKYLQSQLVASVPRAAQSAITCAAPPLGCAKSPYRTLDGSCNNLQNPGWGSANNRYNRLLSAKYGDGISSPTTSITGQDLPNSRVVSLVVFGEEDVPDPQFTIANMQWVGLTLSIRLMFNKFKLIHLGTSYHPRHEYASRRYSIETSHHTLLYE